MTTSADQGAWFDLTIRPEASFEVSAQPDGSVEISAPVAGLTSSRVTLLLRPDEFRELVGRANDLLLMGRVPG